MFWMHVPLVQNDFLFCWHAFAVHGFDSRDYLRIGVMISSVAISMATLWAVWPGPEHHGTVCSMLQTLHPGFSIQKM